MKNKYNLTPEQLLIIASDENSSFHNFFNWNDPDNLLIQANMFLRVALELIETSPKKKRKLRSK